MKAKFEITHLKVPISKSKIHQTHHGHFSEFEIFIVKAENESGEVGYGEYVHQPGYNPFHHTMAFGALEAVIKNFDSRSPFITTAVNTAMETIGLEYPKMTVPIVGSISNIFRFALDTEKYENQGFTTVKANIFPQMVREPKLIAEITNTMQKFPNINFRFNAGAMFQTDHDLAMMSFLALDNAKILVDPMAHMHLATHFKNAATSLDKWMWFDTDFHNYCGRHFTPVHNAKYVTRVHQLRLPKHGAIKGIERMLTKARGYGIEVIIGSDIGSDICAVNEMYVYDKYKLDNVSEICGFTKQTSNFVKGLSYSKGNASFKGGKIEIDMNKNDIQIIESRIIEMEDDNPFQLREYPRVRC